MVHLGALYSQSYESADENLVYLMAKALDEDMTSIRMSSRRPAEYTLKKTLDLGWVKPMGESSTGLIRYAKRRACGPRSMRNFRRQV